MNNNVMRRTLSAALCIALIVTSLIAGAGDSFAAAKPAKVKVSTLKAKSMEIILKWKKAKGAKKYQVFRKIGKGKFKRVTTLKKTSYTQKAKSGKRYSFKVRGINGTRKGAFSDNYIITVWKKKSGEEKTKIIKTKDDNPEQTPSVDTDLTHELKVAGDEYCFFIEAKDGNGNAITKTGDGKGKILVQVNGKALEPASVEGGKLNYKVTGPKGEWTTIMYKVVDKYGNWEQVKRAVFFEEQK